MSIVLNAFVQNLILLLLVPLIIVAIVWIGVHARLVWAKFKTEKPDLAAELEWAAGVAVKSAEQAGLMGFVKEKKSYAIHIVETLLALKGITIDLDPIEAAIEAAVWDQMNKYNPDKNPSVKAATAYQAQAELEAKSNAEASTAQPK
jgi:hypothetical protein